MDNDTRADSDEQRTHAATDLVEESADDSEGRLDIHDDLEALNRRIDEMYDEMIHPQAVQLVLEHIGISETQAAHLVKTMQDVDHRTRDDDTR